MRRTIVWLGFVCLATGIVAAAPAAATEGFIAGLNGGVAAPVGKFDNRAKPGGGGGLYAGYMFLDYIGLVGEAQVVGFDAKFDSDRITNDIWALGGLAGPRVALPFSIADIPFELNGTWEGGVFTGLNGNTPISHTSWGYSTGGGLDMRLSDDFLLGIFTRYNWIDQRTEPHEDVQYITGGISLTYNALPARPPAPVVPPPPEPIAEVPPVVRTKIVLRGVQFDFGSAAIRADARPVLDEAANTLEQAGGTVVIAEGHTDDVGSDATNMQLSERRAEAVRDYLVGAGIAASRIRAEGFGESQPVASNDTAEGRAQNRRVELHVQGE